MANVDKPRGFEVIQKVDGTHHALEYFDLSATNGAIGKNDLVEMRDTGTVEQAQATSVTIVGVAAEKKAANAGGKIAVFPVSAATRLRAQVDDASVAAQTNCGLNYDIVVGAPDSLGFSIMEVDGSTGATTSTLPIKVLRKEESVQYGKSNEFGANVVVECAINANALYAGGAGV